MTVRFPNALRTARASQLQALIGNNAIIRIYSGTIPANADTAVSGQTLLAQFTFGEPFGTVNNGVLTASNMSVGTFGATASGQATWFRILTAAEVARLDGTVSATGEGGDLQLDSTNIVSGLAVTVTQFIWTEPS